jgi:hypothetical protein
MIEGRKRDGVVGDESRWTVTGRRKRNEKLSNEEHEKLLRIRTEARSLRALTRGKDDTENDSDR